jgi:hypothetical protein
MQQRGFFRCQANIKLARQYYASALQLSDGRSPRALYGVTAATAALAASGQQKVWCRTLLECELIGGLSRNAVIWCWRLVTSRQPSSANQMMHSMPAPAGSKVHAQVP